MVRSRTDYILFKNWWHLFFFFFFFHFCSRVDMNYNNDFKRSFAPLQHFQQLLSYLRCSGHQANLRPTSYLNTVLLENFLCSKKTWRVVYDTLICCSFRLRGVEVVVHLVYEERNHLIHDATYMIPLTKAVKGSFSLNNWLIQQIPHDSFYRITRSLTDHHSVKRIGLTL